MVAKPQDSKEYLLNIIKKHEDWRGNRCINLISSENIMNPNARCLLSSEVGHRYAARVP